MTDDEVCVIDVLERYDGVLDREQVGRVQVVSMMS